MPHEGGLIEPGESGLLRALLWWELELRKVDGGSKSAAGESAYAGLHRSTGLNVEEVSRVAHAYTHLVGIPCFNDAGSLAMMAFKCGVQAEAARARGFGVEEGAHWEEVDSDE